MAKGVTVVTVVTVVIVVTVVTVVILVRVGQTKPLPQQIYYRQCFGWALSKAILL